jgi:hypothetical protein
VKLSELEISVNLIVENINEKRKISTNNNLRSKRQKDKQHQHQHIKERKSKNWVSFARMPFFVSRVEMLQRAKSR